MKPVIVENGLQLGALEQQITRLNCQTQSVPVINMPSEKAEMVWNRNLITDKTLAWQKVLVYRFTSNKTKQNSKTKLGKGLDSFIFIHYFISSLRLNIYFTTLRSNQVECCWIFFIFQYFHFPDFYRPYGTNRGCRCDCIFNGLWAA